MTRNTRIVSALVGGLLLLATALLLLLPVPRQDIGLLGGTLYCGPGASSDSALQIMLNPDDVNAGRAPQADDGKSPDEVQRQDRASVQICQTAAKSRFIWASVAFLLAVVAGLALPSIFGRRDTVTPEV